MSSANIFICFGHPLPISAIRMANNIGDAGDPCDSLSGTCIGSPIILFLLGVMILSVMKDAVHFLIDSSTPGFSVASIIGT